MKIAIDGPQSTGKTTLFYDLQSVLGSDYDFIPEAARIIAPIFSIAVPSDWSALLNDRARLAEYFRDEERWLTERQSRSSDYVVDSSLLLIAAYRIRCGIPINTRILSGTAYDLILYCSPEDVLAEDDGFRFLSGRADVDRVYHELQRTFHRGPIVPLPGGPSRQAIALAAIRQHDPQSA